LHFCYVFSILAAYGSSSLVGCIFTFLDIFSSNFTICTYRHTASIAAGNHGIPVVVAGHQFGNASGMAPRAQ
jgi:hypothetical protein